MMTQNEIQRLHDLANKQAWELNDRMRLELSELACRAVQLLIAQSIRIKQLKSLNEASQPAVEPRHSPNRNSSDFGSIFGDMFGRKFK